MLIISCQISSWFLLQLFEESRFFNSVNTLIQRLYITKNNCNGHLRGLKRWCIHRSGKREVPNNKDVYVCTRASVANGWALLLGRGINAVWIQHDSWKKQQKRRYHFRSYNVVIYFSYYKSKFKLLRSTYWINMVVVAPSNCLSP